MDESEWAAREGASNASVDVSGSPNAAKAHSFAYLAAKHRLVLAYAEHESQAA